MELDDKMIAEIASQLGISQGGRVDKAAAERLASKSDAELEREILKIKNQLRANNITYDKQLMMLKNPCADDGRETEGETAESHRTAEPLK